jgi:hypothetical protein
VSNTFLPFNFAPKAHQVLNTGGTTTYTIPANEFALVTISANLAPTSGSVNLNGSTIFRSAFIEQTSAQAINSVSITAPGYGRSFVSGFSNSGAGSPITGGTLKKGETATYVIGGGVSVTLNLETLVDENLGSPSQYWVKAGDVVSISGGQLDVVIHRYDLPS